jgi:hypothetical protein
MFNVSFMGMGLSEVVAWDRFGWMASVPGGAVAGEQPAMTAARETASRALPGFLIRNGMVVLSVRCLV